MTLDICKRFYDAYSKPTILRGRISTTLYPSQASIKIDDQVFGSCHRESFFKYKGYAEGGVINPDYSLAADMGDWIHSGLANSIRNRPLELGLTLLSEEQGFSFPGKDYILSGRIDDLVMDNETGKLYGIDVKSVGEFAGNMTMHKPKVEHILQCAVYLYAFNQTAQHGNRPIEEWIIWYVSRDENWNLKKNAHGSSMKMMWQYSVFFEDGHVSVRKQSGEVLRYKEITIEKILDRYTDLAHQIETDDLPDREYEAQYSEETIVGLYKTDGLQFKKDIAKVEKWMKKGAPEGELNMQMGDSACRFCSYATQCYSADPESYPKQENLFYDIRPLNEKKKKEASLF